MEIDAEIRQAFFDDAMQMVDSAEALLMSLDGEVFPEATVDSLFRSAHNLKGGSMAMGYESLSHFAHEYEDLLSLLKKGTLRPTKQIKDLLFQGIDVLKSFVNGLKGDDKFKMDTTAVSEALKAAVTSAKAGGDVAAPAAEAAAEPVPAPESTPEPVPHVVAEKAPATQGASPKAPGSEDLIRVNTAKLDSLLNLIGELVINQSILTRHKVDQTSDSDHALQTVSYMQKLVNEVQDVAMSLRMTNVKGLFQKMQRSVRDTASALDKDVLLVTEGEHVELDRTIIERMGDPLTHLVRNAVDHGVETREARVAAGKPERSSVYLSARQQDDIVLITVRDDGKGLDADKLVAKAREKGILGPGETVTRDEAYALIFKPGFSTKEQVSDISGRGVGMDVVSRAVEEMKGSIRVETELGRGTSFVISLPLSLSIINGMVVTVGAKKYVIPVSQLVETLEYRKFRVETSTRHGRMINLRGEVIPVLSLDRLLGGHGAGDGQGAMPGVVTSVSGRKISFEVDELLGQQQVVIKKLGRKMENLPGIIGGAILSNGEPSLVLNLTEFSTEQGRKRAAA